MLQSNADYIRMEPYAEQSKRGFYIIHRENFLQQYANIDCTLIFYCAPHDVLKTVSALYDSLGDRNACAVREITKLHESVEYFSLKDGYANEPRGEYVIIVEGAKSAAQNYENLSVEENEIYKYTIK